MPDATAERLYHLVQTAHWNEAVQSQQPYFPHTYSQDGFIHLTAEPDLLLEVANRFYRDSPGDWEVLVLDPAKLTSEVKFEPAAPVGDKAAQLSDERKWPHLYGTIDFAAVERRLPVRRDGEARFLEILRS